MKKNHLTLLSLLVLIGCSSKLPPVTFPNVSNFNSVLVKERWESFDNYGQESLITDEKLVDRIFQVLTSETNNWQEPFRLYYSFAYRALLEFRGDDNQIIFYVTEKNICYGKSINATPNVCISSPESIVILRNILKNSQVENKTISNEF